MKKQFTILPVKTDQRGEPVAFDVSDADAHTFLIMDGSTEEMRASTRQHAQAWIDAANLSHEALIDAARETDKLNDA